MKKAAMFVVLSILVLATALSQEPPDEPTYDYTDDNNYQNPGFYTDSDPGRWDWSRIDWEKMDFERADLYLYSDFYLYLPIERYGDLNYRLVNYAFIDQNRIDAKKYVQDFGCIECTFEAGVEGTELRYNEEGQIMHLRSGDNAYSGDFPSGSFFRVSENGITIQCPPTATSLCTSDRGMFTIETILQETIEGEFEPRILDYRGHSVRGLLSFREGQLYVKIGDIADIDRVSIGNVPGTSGIDIYFDGLAHTGSYVSFGEDNLIIHSEQGASTYRFETGNQYFETPHELFGDPDELVFRPGAGSTMIVQDRSEQNLVPRVTIIAPGDDPARLTNGGTTLELNREGVYVRIFSEGRESTPLALVPLGEIGDNLNLLELGTIMLFDEENNALVVDESVADEAFERERALCSDCPVSQILASIEEGEVFFDYYRAQIFDALQAVFTAFRDDPVILSNVLRSLRQVPSEQLATVAAIHVVTPEDIESRCGENAAGCALHSSRVIYISANSLERSVGLLPHEIAHDWTYFIENRDFEMATEEYAELFNALIATYGSLENIPPEENSRLVERAPTTSRYFRTRWETNAGDIYGQDLGERTVGGDNAATWGNGIDEPRYGCFRAYGCNNFYEDVATSAEQFYEDPQRVRELINPESQFYQTRMGSFIGSSWETMTPEVAEDWAQRYRGRVELLHEYEYITEEDYRQVVGEQE